MSVFMLCERALGLLNASDLRELDSEDRALLENLNYDGLVNGHVQREAVVCARHFPNVRDRLLQLHPWVFARKEVSPVEMSSPVEGWRFAYMLPTDCLKVLSLIDRPHRHHGIHPHHYHGHYHKATGAMSLQHYEQIGRVICCNFKDIHLRYTAKIENTDLWDPSYVDAFCSSLAMEIAPSVCSTPVIGASMAQAMNVLAQSAILQAHRTGAVSEANELPTQEPLWMDYSGVPTGFDDPGKWGF
jgi:hypothetical protein